MTFWFYVKTPANQFVRLPSGRFYAFHFKGGRLEPSWADSQSFVSIAQFGLETEEGLPVQVVAQWFSKVSLSPDGLRAETQGEVVSRLAKRLQASGAYRRSQRPAGGLSNVIEASDIFDSKRSNDPYEWLPTGGDVTNLGRLLQERIGKAARAREAQLARLESVNSASQIDMVQQQRLPEWKLRHLILSADPEVRAAVAARRSTPCSILSDLENDSSSAVLAALASNPNSDDEWLQAMAMRAAEEIRVVIAKNPSTPDFIVERMAWADKSSAVRESAQARIEERVGLWLKWARAPGASEASLLRCARHPRQEVRLAVAENASASSNVLATLAADPDPRVRDAAARQA